MRPRLPQNIADVSTPYRSPAPYTVIVATLLVLFLGALATIFHKPLIVPPIGPTIFIVLAFPLAQEAQPRNVLCGHLLGITAGALALVIFGLLDTPPDLLREPEDWVALMVAVVIVLAVALVLARLRGVPMPLWSRSEAPRMAASEEKER
jgi:Na+/proline symporter